MSGFSICRQCGAWSLNPCSFCGHDRPGFVKGYTPPKEKRCEKPASGAQRCRLRLDHHGDCHPEAAQRPGDELPLGQLELRGLR